LGLCCGAIKSTLKNIIHLALFLFTTIVVQHLSAQYPRYFTYDNENGLPSSEVYCMVQDEDGFLWFGTDAGLCKFDGVHYTSYKCSTQKSKSITGLTLSTSGRLYCFNFQSQIFCIENDTLKEIQSDLPRINNLCSDNNGNLYTSHSRGVSRYNEAQKEWHHYFPLRDPATPSEEYYLSKITRGNLLDTIRFISTRSVGTIVQNNLELTASNRFETSYPSGYLLEHYADFLWIFSRELPEIHLLKNNKTETKCDPVLFDILSGRKITAVKSLADGNLWICTYRGVICYNHHDKKTELYYPEFSFSDCLLDNEGNYWFSTLHAGIIRIPNLHFIVWNNLENNSLNKLTTDGTNVFFSSVNGRIGRINPETNEVRIFTVQKDADVQSLDFDPIKKSVLFNINNLLYELTGNTIQNNEGYFTGIKSVLRLENHIFSATSLGSFINSNRIDSKWARKIVLGNNNIVWIATNEGLLKVEYLNNQWQLTETIFEDTLIAAITYDDQSQKMFAVDFKGNFYCLYPHNKWQYLATPALPIQPYAIRYHNENLYVASNNGIHILNIPEKKFSSVRLNAGLASDNIRDITILNDNIWIVTGKGLQKIRIDRLNTEPPLSKIYLKENESIIQKVALSYGEVLTVHPQLLSYKSLGQFVYAYRINNNNTWTHLPATIEQLELQNIPWGEFELQLKAIDYLGRDSENTIIITGIAHPPFWKTWWFVGLIVVLISAVVLYVSNSIVKNIKKRERQKSKYAKYQLTALKARMNPHFMYNTLNSIQALILKKDVQNSNLYLTRFSQLMRIVLESSDKEEITLQEETNTLSLYLSLEKLRFGNEFHYTLTVSDQIDHHNVMIPPLIIQPFVENAIKHGLLHKKGEKDLSIQFSLNNDYLMCVITDNGVGRERASLIKERQHTRHNSFSVEATKKRVTLLNRFTGKKSEVNIRDLYQNGEASGTEVSIRIPLIISNKQTN